MMQKVFRYLEPCKRNPRVCRTDGRTDRHMNIITAEAVQPRYTTLRGRKTGKSQIWYIIDIFHCFGL